MRRLLEALNRSRKDLRAMLKLLENGKMLDGRSYIIHNARDPVASPDLSLWVARQMKDRALFFGWWIRVTPRPSVRDL